MSPARTNKRKIRILIADREGVFRLGLRRLLSIEDDLRVVGQAENSAQLLAGAKTFRPDLLFLQAEIVAEMPGDLLAEIRREAPQGKIVITGSALSDDEAARYAKAGAAGVILKSAEPTLFVKCARKVMGNESWLPKTLTARAAQSIEGAPERPLRPVETLTRQEKVIISHLMQGCRNREIAQHLSITEQTVKNHLRMIYDKVGVSDRLELVLYAIHQRLELPKPQAVMAAHP
jgi:DNA-binding NarL/FixJ family response regulator